MPESKYKALFDKLYLEEKQNNGCPPKNKLQFVGYYIFDFTTYDNDVDELFAQNMVEVITCILNKTTFEYQENTTKYYNYLIMVNMPFLRGKLDWGTSIRGAWFDEYGHPSEKEGEKIYNIGDQIIPKKKIKHFLSELLNWIKEP